MFSNYWNFFRVIESFEVLVGNRVTFLIFLHDFLIKCYRQDCLVITHVFVRDLRRVKPLSQKISCS